MSILEKAKTFWAKGRSYLAPDGTEYPDPTPMSLPVGFERPESIQDMIKRLVTDRQIRDELDSMDAETFDEADDFNVPDDMHVDSPYEEQFDPEGVLTRDHEIQHGVVKAPTPEQIAAAKAVLDAAKAQQAAAVVDPPVKA